MKYTVNYNKAQIMRQAHKFYRDGRMGDFGTCLKKAWQNAKTVKAGLEEVGTEARTYAEWVALGYEVIHGEKNVKQVIVNSVRYVRQLTETLSFFTREQVIPIGFQTEKR